MATTTRMARMAKPNIPSGSSPSFRSVRAVVVDIRDNALRLRTGVF